MPVVQPTILIDLLPSLQPQPDRLHLRRDAQLRTLEILSVQVAHPRPRRFPLRALALNHRVGHGIRMPLIHVTGLTDAAFEAHHARPLLHNMRRLVGRGVKAGRPLEGHIITAGIGQSPHLVTGRARATPRVGADARHVMATESRLNLG